MARQDLAGPAETIKHDDDKHHRPIATDSYSIGYQHYHQRVHIVQVHARIC